MRLETVPAGGCVPGTRGARGAGALAGSGSDRASGAEWSRSSGRGVEVSTFEGEPPGTPVRMHRRRDPAAADVEAGGDGVERDERDVGPRQDRRLLGEPFVFLEVRDPLRLGEATRSPTLLRTRGSPPKRPHARMPASHASSGRASTRTEGSSSSFRGACFGHERPGAGCCARTPRHGRGRTAAESPSGPTVSEERAQPVGRPPWRPLQLAGAATTVFTGGAGGRGVGGINRCLRKPTMRVHASSARARS